MLVRGVIRRRGVAGGTLHLLGRCVSALSRSESEGSEGVTRSADRSTCNKRMWKRGFLALKINPPPPPPHRRRPGPGTEALSRRRCLIESLSLAHGGNTRQDERSRARSRCESPWGRQPSERLGDGPSRRA